MPLTGISSLQHIPPVPVPPVAAKLLPPQPKSPPVPRLCSVRHTTQPPQLASQKRKNQPPALLSVKHVPTANFSLAAPTLTVSEPHSDVSVVFRSHLVIMPRKLTVPLKVCGKMSQYTVQLQYIPIRRFVCFHNRGYTPRQRLCRYSSVNL